MGKLPAAVVPSGAMKPMSLKKKSSIAGIQNTSVIHQGLTPSRRMMTPISQQGVVPRGEVRVDEED